MDVTRPPRRARTHCFEPHQVGPCAAQQGKKKRLNPTGGGGRVCLVDWIQNNEGKDRAACGLFRHCAANFSSCNVGDGNYYGGFGDIPTTYWQITAVISGAGLAGIALSFLGALYVVVRNDTGKQVRRSLLPLQLCVLPMLPTT